jgi:hypothetical protein
MQEEIGKERLHPAGVDSCHRSPIATHANSTEQLDSGGREAPRSRTGRWLRRGRGHTCGRGVLTPRNLFLGRFPLSNRSNAAVDFVVGCYSNIEDVSAARYGSDNRLRVAPESTPDLRQALHQGVVSYKGVFPDCAYDLFLREETPVIFSQEAEHFEGFWAKLDVHPVPAQASTRKINDKPVEPKGLRP